LGGYLLSRIPAYQAQQIGEELISITQSPNPFLAAAQLSHSFSCAAM
jgi:hypothetical protein